MRNLLSATISSVALAMLVAGSTLAASMPSSSQPEQMNNQALQAQLERDIDSSGSWLRQSPVGQVLTIGRATQPSNGQSKASIEPDERTHPSRDD